MSQIGRGRRGQPAGCCCAGEPQASGEPGFELFPANRGRTPGCSRHGASVGGPRLRSDQGFSEATPKAFRRHSEGIPNKPRGNTLESGGGRLGQPAGRGWPGNRKHRGSPDSSFFPLSPFVAAAMFLRSSFDNPSIAFEEAEENTEGRSKDYRSFPPGFRLLPTVSGTDCARRRRGNRKAPVPWGCLVVRLVGRRTGGIARTDESPSTVLPKNPREGGYSPSKDGAREGTRTLTPYGTRPSNVCVYQFHHPSSFQKRNAD